MNHWLQLHKLREAKKECEVCLFGGDSHLDLIAVQPFQEWVEFVLQAPTVIVGFYIQYKDRIVLEQLFQPGPIHLKVGEKVELDLRKLQFYLV